MSIFLGAIDKKLTKKELELKRLKLFSKALKLYPNTKSQLKVRAEIEEINKHLK